MVRTISKYTPLSEITLRRYEKPYFTSRRDSIKKLCLSIGLLQPGDSRDIIVDALQVLLEAKKTKKMMDLEDLRKKVIKLRKTQKLELKGIASSNIRRQIKRLRDVFLVEKIQNNYRITEFEDLNVIFEKRIKDFYLKSILERVQEHFNSVK